jgi:branched-chain amino acid transport system substrate-binding protein
MSKLFACLIATLVVVATLGTPARAADPYNINVILSMTGQGAFLGKSAAIAIDAAEQVINKQGGIKGRPVHFVIQDDQSDPKLAVQLFNQVVASKVPIVLGPDFSAPCYAVVPLVKEDIVQYCLAPSIHPPAGAYSFSGSVSTKDLAAAGIRYFRMRGLTKIAVLDTTDATGQDGDNIIKENLALPENKGMSIVAFEHMAPSDVNVTAQMSRIEASGAQAVIAWVTGSPFGTVLHAAFDTGLSIPLLTNAGNISNGQMSQYVQFLPKELVFTGLRFLGHAQSGPGPVRDVQAAFYSALREKGIEPDLLYSIPWDPVMVTVDALRHVGTNASAKQVHDYIENLHGFPGINGEFDFRDGSQRGIGADAALIVKWVPDTKEWIPVSGFGGKPLAGK